MGWAVQEKAGKGMAGGKAQGTKAECFFSFRAGEKKEGRTRQGQNCNGRHWKTGRAGRKGKDPKAEKEGTYRHMVEGQGNAGGREVWVGECRHGKVGQNLITSWQANACSGITPSITTDNGHF